MKETPEKSTMIDLEEMGDFIVIGRDSDGRDIMVASNSISVQRMGSLLGTMLAALITESAGAAFKRLKDEG